MVRTSLAALAAALLAGQALAQAPPPPAAPAAAPPPMAAAPAAVTLAANGDLDATLKSSPQFSILAKAIDGSGLAPVLKSQGPLTLLAPTDDAFRSLPPGELDMLMKPENASTLQHLLAYHLINAAVPMSKVQGAKGPIVTVAGTPVVIDGTTTPLQINDAHILGETQTSNGMIYIVDKVLTPPGAAASAPPAP